PPPAIWWRSTSSERNISRQFTKADVHDDWGADSMTDFSAETDAMRAFAATHESVAADIAGAGNMDTVSHVAAMTPVFGIIGADYLAMFAAAQVLHCQDI